MPRKKRSKSPSLVPHLANPSRSRKSSNKPRRSKQSATNSAYKKNPCCATLHSFMESIMKNLEILFFCSIFVGFIFLSYYVNIAVQAKWFNVEYSPQEISSSLYLQLVPYLIFMFSTLCVSIFASYLFQTIVLWIAPKGHDKNAYSVGRARFHPYRVFKFMYTCFQMLHTLLYIRSYVRVIAAFRHQCRRHCLDGDLDNMQCCDFSASVLASIVRGVNERVLHSVHQKRAVRQKYLLQSNVHYEAVITHSQPQITLRRKVQCAHDEMVSLLNVHYDPRDALQTADVFLPPSLCLRSTNQPKNGFAKDDEWTASATPVLIFLVGGAWGSCDVTFSASAAASFVAHKLAFIYPSYAVFPAGDVASMLQNINAIIQWTIQYSSALNINPNHIVIVGQSAGAHLGALAVLKAYQQKSKWLKRVRLFCGLAGPYDIADHYRFESNRGIENLSPMSRAMRGCSNFGFYSPTTIAQELMVQLLRHKITHKLDYDKTLNFVRLCFPHFLLIHSRPDYVVPLTASHKLHKILTNLGVDCECVQYANGSHYDSLFGLCDAGNVLFNALITDIVTRVFVVCTAYNRDPSLRSAWSPSPSSTLDRDDSKQDAGDDDEKMDVDGSGEYDFEDQEMVKIPAAKKYNLQNMENKKKQTTRMSVRCNANSKHLMLPRAHSLHAVDVISNHSSMSEDDNDEDDEEDDDSDENNNEEEKAETEDETAGGTPTKQSALFEWNDFDPNKTTPGEAIQFIKNLLGDMDKALDAISSLNHNLHHHEATPQDT